MDISFMIQKLPIMLYQGTLLTLELTALSLCFGTVFGVILALFKISKSLVLSKIASFYIWLFRGTPLLLQLFFFYYGLPSISKSLEMKQFPAAVLALTLNCAAYMAEIIRGGIISIEKGQFEASKALGFTYIQTMGKIVLPQTFRVIMPPVGNEFIAMIKDTSLVSSIALTELLRTATNIASATFKYPEMLTLAAIYYLILTTLFTSLFSLVEKKLSVYA
ncbi:MAG: amino acid ABC transporter permease [Bacillota bacterium]|nr:amino acid ABC transporter permease [Bacillota bacterium]